MKKTIFIIIIGLSALLRLYQISVYPSGLNADEAALGYNAYSLIQTGRDEHGNVWPINFESFGDFKPALYGYVLIPFIKIFGLTEFAVRLPSALIGIIAVVLMYFLTKEIYLTSDPSPKLGEGNERGEVLGLLSALLLAISPWHIHFSRGAWEVNLATTLLMAGVLAFLIWLRNPKLRFLLTVTVTFVLSMYAYQSTRVTAPLLGLGLFVFYYKNFMRLPRQIIITAVVTIVLVLPLVITLVTSGAASRFSGVGLLADEGPLNRVKEQRGHYENPSNIFSRILHNRPVIYSIQFVDNYTRHFSGDFLFVNGDPIQRNKVPETGLFYITDAVFLLLGVYCLIRTSRVKTKVLWLWVLVAPVAAGLTFQSPHALRAQALVIPLTIIISAGIVFLKEYPFRWKRILLFLVLTVYLYQFSRYLHQYYVHYPQAYPAAWEYGFKDLVSYVESVQSNYKRILVTTKYDQPYILFLFYLKYPPQLFQGNHQLTVRDKFNFSTVNNFDKYTFTNTSWENVRDIRSSLIIAAPEDIPDVGVNIVKTIYFPNGDPAFKIVSN